MYAALQGGCRHIIIVTNTPEAYASYEAEVTTDACGKRGSLVGLYSGLLKSRDEYNFVVACDMPFLNSGLCPYMAGLTAGRMPSCPKVGDLIEPLHAVYRRLASGDRRTASSAISGRIRDIFAGTAIRYVTEEEIDRFDPERRSFINMNTRKEYEEVTCSDLECRN